MGGRIPEHAIQDIRERINLVELIGERTALRRRGRNHVGLCPFHGENTPSFTVSEERGFFHCFGCGASGNAFVWVMRTENVEFPEAVRLLADRVGVSLPEIGGNRRDRNADDLLYRVNEDAAAFYQRALWEDGGGAAARTYLAARGIDEDHARSFRLGFAPATGGAYVSRVRSRRIPVEAALTAGVIGRRGDGSLVDRFRARIMFPITEPGGRVAGFGGRILPEAPPEAPKYINSAESPVFKKRRLLYGLREARQAMRSEDRALLVEGYIDVLSLHQHGIEIAVAPLGTAVSADQLRVLRRYAGDVLACFDGDDAGRKAASRSFAVFVEAGLWGRAVLLPAGEDPDSLVRGQGPAVFTKLLSEARPLLDIFLRALVDPQNPSISRRIQAAREVGRLLQRVRNPLEYDLLARRAAERLGIGEDLLRKEGASTAQPDSFQGKRSVRRTTGEEMVVELMLTGKDAVERVSLEGGADLFDDPQWRALAAAVLERARSGADTVDLLERLPDEMRARVAGALLDPEADVASRDRLIEDCLGFIRRRQARRRVRQVLEEVRAAEAAGDTDRLRERLQQWRALVQGGAGDWQADHEGP